AGWADPDQPRAGRPPGQAGLADAEGRAAHRRGVPALDRGAAAAGRGARTGAHGIAAGRLRCGHGRRPARSRASRVACDTGSHRNNHQPSGLMSALIDSLIAELENEAATTRRVLERVPEDRFSWAPHPKSMTLGKLAQHVAEIPGKIADLLDPPESRIP